jgi:surfeit locus 1 family protein
MAKLRFETTLWPALAAAVGIAITVALGFWQVGRAHQKEALRDEIAAANRDGLISLSTRAVRADDLLWRRVEVRGHFEPRYGILIDNRVLHGVPGYQVVMPLDIQDSGRYVLVNRGWISSTGSRSVLPDVKTPAGEVDVVGLATVPSTRPFELSGNAAEGKVWENLRLDRYQAAVPIALQPIVIEQENDLSDGLKREWTLPDFGIDMHHGYAFQWFALAVTIMVFYVVTHVKRET